MKLNVYVLDQQVAVLEQAGNFKSVMAYLPEVALRESRTSDYAGTNGSQSNLTGTLHLTRV